MVAITRCNEASALSSSGWFGRGVLDLEHHVIVPTFVVYFPKDPEMPQPPRVPGPRRRFAKTEEHGLNP